MSPKAGELPILVMEGEPERLMKTVGELPDGAELAANERGCGSHGERRLSCCRGEGFFNGKTAHRFVLPRDKSYGIWIKRGTM